MDIQEILIKSTVRISGPNLFNHGTGFFIDEETILTCYHCIEDFNHSRIPIYFNNGIYREAIYFESQLSEEKDVALLKIDIKSKYAVVLQDGISPNNSAILFGYSDDNPNGSSVGLECEGLSYNEKGYKLIKFRNGNIRKGHSGSPILNLETGAVVGITKETNHPNHPSGGYGIPLRDILECYPEVIKLNIQYNLNNNLWNSLNRTQKKGLGVYNQTITDGHFELFSTGIKIDEIFIQPNYKIISYQKNDILQELSKSGDIIEDSLRILNKLKFLFILGSFGTGKSILSKMIQRKLITDGQKTLFFRCSDVSLIKNYSDFYNLIIDLKANNQPLFCFFDGYDELNLLGNDNLEIIGNFLKNLIRLSKEPEIYVSLNSRNIHKKEDEVYLSISLQFNELRDICIEYIVLDEYTNDQIRDYLDAFSNAMAKRKKEHRLYLKDIKRLHKNLKKACYNPLFLYSLESAFYEKGIEEFSELYDIYESFVQKTILGKFSDDKNPDNQAILEIREKYKIFLRKLASEILIRNRRIEFDREQIYEFYLDKNEKSYYIENAKISNEIQQIAAEILSKDLLNNISQQRLRENVLTCYFLDSNGSFWRIKDNNLLFFLVAEGYYERLSLVLNKYIYYSFGDRSEEDISEHEFYNELYESFKFEKRIPLHPLTIEFLFQKIDRLTEDKKEFLWSFIKSLIDNEQILNISAENIKKLDIAKVNIDIILLLIFKRINTAGYDEINLIYFFKRYYWFISAAKIVDRNYLYLAQRFFKASNIKGVELRRINFDGYNFDYSKLKNIHFIQDKFHEVRMNFCELDRTIFTLCDLKSVEFSGFKGNVQFKNCIIEKLYVKNAISSQEKISSLTFKNCQIKHLEIHSEEKNVSHTIDIKFVGSDINALIVDNTLFRNFILRNCMHSELNLNDQHIKHFDRINCQTR